jgi:hypothetical protein
VPNNFHGGALRFGVFSTSFGLERERDEARAFGLCHARLRRARGVRFELAIFRQVKHDRDAFTLRIHNITRGNVFSARGLGYAWRAHAFVCG